MEILFNELVKETQKKLIEEAIYEQFFFNVKVSNIQVFRDQYFRNQMPTGDDDEDVFLKRYHYVYADTQTVTFQLLWNLTEHHFEPDILVRPKKKGIEIPPVQAPEPIKKVEKKPKRTPKKENKDGKVQENGGNAEG